LVVAQKPQEYLVNHGNAGDFGRFQACGPLVCRRGDAVVIQGRAGLELGVVLCEATPKHLQLLHQVPVGRLLRLATEEDHLAALQMRERGHFLFEESRRLASELGLPLEILDVEVSLDGRQGEIQFLGPPHCDLDPFAAALAHRNGLFVLLHNLALPVKAESGGCGEPNCGQANGSGCTSCSTGGGCATGCGHGKADMKDYFAHLRAQMEKRNITPLL
jgi:hypothetical protein